MRQSCFIANQSGRDILVAEWPYRDLPIMAIKGTTFSSCITGTSPYSFGNFRKLSLYNCFMPI